MIKNKDDMELLLAKLKERHEKANNEHNKCPEGRLVQVKREGKLTYFQVLSCDNRDKRISINKRPEIIKGLARKKYIETELNILDRDMRLLKKLIKGYLDVSADNILDNLPARFKKLPEEYFFTGQANCTGIFDQNTITEEMRQWAAAPFVQSNYKPWLKDKTTAVGLKVRTKSEVIVAEKLDAYQLPHRYEEMIYIENYSFAPDFTILTPNGIWYWEHCGKVHDKGYLGHHDWKMGMYRRAGIVPWKNLIVTYDDENGGIDTRIIEAEIRNKLLTSF